MRRPCKVSVRAQAAPPDKPPDVPIRTTSPKPPDNGSYVIAIRLRRGRRGTFEPPHPGDPTHPIWHRRKLRWVDPMLPWPDMD